MEMILTGMMMNKYLEATFFTILILGIGVGITLFTVWLIDNYPALAICFFSVLVFFLIYTIVLSMV